MIDKVAWIEVRNRRVAFVRSKGNTLFYNVGGKREGNETDQQTLARELQEELQLTLIPGTCRFLQTFRGPVAGKPDTVVEIRCYTGNCDGVMEPSTEIEEIGWFSSADGERTTPTGRQILSWLKAQDLID